ncbi:peptidoglycan DD-metalloendopeptidase family protein [Robertmurraya korlensis]|uniref:peptidoglycan DD-metalloendopeptidase family protein n=1 Tax=Robertmurraya korlensis TaxID=519977 RepID=UPI00203CA80B|nr:peptidoglycan DD-metalloendopeptidase family protein [Robertmurraya korlensis]MCM3599736.1 peptidoglycan DD-metalloendopeptidase family protein [Robertmurraya korlensis]
MRDYIKRFLIAGLMALCVTLLFLGGKHSQASMNISQETADWIWPADGMITDTYGTRKGSHKGIDIASSLGTPIFSVDGGVVTKSYYSGSYGHVIFVKHQNNIETVYAHLKARFVNAGDTVAAGQQLGEMGSTGDSSGVHLHFEVHLNEWTVDKRNAVNPVLALGEVKVGQEVAVQKREEDSSVLETVAKTRLYEGHGKTYQANEESESVVLSAEKVESNITHTVKTGETLSSIAEQYNISITAIQSANHLTSDTIVVNQTLTIDPSYTNKYVVQEGDTLEEIAHKTGKSVQQLKQVNQLQNDMIIPRQVLQLE